MSLNNLLLILAPIKEEENLLRLSEMQLIQSEYTKSANDNQIVKSDSQHMVDTNKVNNNHIFNITNYKSPTFCDFCSQLLLGLRKQGFKCECKILLPLEKFNFIKY